jgi:prepilin-type N-terminal cleavage/methylation domain-containing protein
VAADINCRRHVLVPTRKSSCNTSAPPQRRRRRVSLRRDDGFTLIETLVAAVVLATGLLGLLGLLDTSVKASAATHQREGATNLARQILEDARGIPFAQLSPASTVSQLQALPGLKNQGSGATWQLVRGKTIYTVTLKECSIDDGKGGEWGVHVNSFGENPFCGDAGEKEWVSGEAGPDPQPEDLKRLTVDVKWTARGRSPDVKAVETLSSSGAAPGLSASNLKLEAPAPDAGTKTEPIITNPATTSLTFSVSSPTGTGAMRWSLEGVAQATAPTLKEGTTWTFSWGIPNPGVSDGTYTVAVQAIDKLGVLGPPVSIPVTLIRNKPAALLGLKGGYNTINVSGAPTKVIELQWQAATERNVIGYRVYRPGGSLACPASASTLSTAINCIDFSSSPYKAATYTAVALYRNVKNEVVEGPSATLAISEGAPTGPGEVKKLKLTRNEGIVELSWEAPTTGAPVSFYRIYRGSTDYTSRYDTAPGTSYTDNEAAEAHSYWVTAVSANLTESTAIGPVTG